MGCISSLINCCGQWLWRAKKSKVIEKVFYQVLWHFSTFYPRVASTVEIETHAVREIATNKIISFVKNIVEDGLLSWEGGSFSETCETQCWSWERLGMLNFDFCF